MSIEKDLIVLGGGPAGYNAALRAAELGLSTVLIEKDELGGTCLNRGCIPTKTLLKSAELLAEINRAVTFGISAEGAADIEAIYARKNAVVGKLRDGIATALKKAKVEVIKGEARFESAHELIVLTADGELTIGAKNVLIATGSAPARLPINGIEYTKNSDEVLSVPVTGQRIAIIGGGVIGCEFARFFASLGRAVTVFETEPRLLPLLDKDVSNYVSTALKRVGVKPITGAKVCAVERTEEGNVICFEVKEKQQREVFDDVLVSVGRIAQTSGLSLEKAGIKVERRIIVDDQFCTTAHNVYAVGDVSSAVQLAHVAEAQGRVVVDRIAGIAPTVDLSAVPSCVYVEPEVATVGRTVFDEESEVVFGRAQLGTLGKAVLEESTLGFAKLAFDRKSRRLLGAALVAPRATDLIGELALALTAGLTADDLIRTVHPHPTICELVKLAADAARF